MKEKTTIIIISIIMLIIGIAIRYVVARRKFNRRTMTGSEVFRSYESAWSIRFVEKVASVVANIFIITGLLSLLAAATKFGAACNATR